ncbi:hypothetical protein HETIRDRAFT_421685 [Heterobasidion irregulare TC 32-1]|uniref:Uncharacterized protein n=1 Tax=Heterobasidion irregulare (strain TC 32-1) TaxID=747525 RepID=W4JVJ8_HETIT|nr:uncharacterized protein HETIRDRAFT_421685 [Heterobasidion irregulare TC 32-1]ETW77567.1 hypothetical protein HETIRDRAFT_421685 [Heterobasidion irregulare TC 32-1]
MERKLETSREILSKPREERWLRNRCLTYCGKFRENYAVSSHPSASFPPTDYDTDIDSTRGAGLNSKNPLKAFFQIVSLSLRAEGGLPF